MAKVLVVDTFAGRRRIPVEVIGETRTKYRVRMGADALIPAARRVKAGDIVLVPKYAIRDI